jgi:hypothetical protein
VPEEPEDRLGGLVQLVAIDLERRAQLSLEQSRGTGKSALRSGANATSTDLVAVLDGYVHRFPELAMHDSDLTEVICAAYRASCLAGGNPSVTALVRRFPDLPGLAEALESAANERVFERQPMGRLDSPAGELPFPEIPGYWVQGVISRGGHGVVYRAVQLGLGRVVAIKTIDPCRRSTATELRRFDTEARAVAQLCHPNIVAVHDVGQTGGVPFIVMEMIEVLLCVNGAKATGFRIARLPST